MSAPFEPGERALLIDQRGRSYLLVLQPGGTYHTHSGTLAHDLVLGRHEGMFGKLPDQLELRIGDVADVGRTGERYDRCVLDLPEPWGALGELRRTLEPGAVLGAYLPTTGQVQQLVLALPAQGFLHIETF